MLQILYSFCDKNGQKDPLRSELLQNFQHFMANMDIFLTNLRISLSNIVVANIVHTLTFIYKDLQHNFIKLGWGVKSTAIFIKFKKRDFFHDGFP